MGKYNCCVPNCSNNWRSSPDLEFHTLPKDRRVRKEYVRQIRNTNLKESSINTRICGAHFPNGQRMSRTELPFIFPWSKSARKRRHVVKHDVNLKGRRMVIQDPQNE